MKTHAGFGLTLLLALLSDGAWAQPVSLASWDTLRVDSILWLRATGSNGVEAAVPASRYGTSLATVESLLATFDLFAHDALYDSLTAREVSSSIRKAVDVLSYDLHARSLGKPLHGLLGTKRQTAIRYSDARWSSSMTLDSYASSVNGIKSRGFKATKLHLPGMPEFSADSIVSALEKVRARVGPDFVLAYDPHPQRGAATNFDDARRIMAACDSFDIAWIEAPLADVDSNIQKYAELRKTYKTRIQNEESRTDYETFLKWAEAGAIDQWCPGIYVHTDVGLTPVVKILRWIQDNPDSGITINYHYTSMEHLHLAFASSDKECPYFESPFSSDDQLRVNLYHTSVGPDGTALAPVWPGIYDCPWLNNGQATVLKQPGRFTTGSTEKIYGFGLPSATTLPEGGVISIWKANGQKVHEFKAGVNGGSFPVKHLPEGLYVWSVINGQYKQRNSLIVNK